MQTVTLNTAKKDLQGLIALTIANNDVTYIVTDMGTGVLIGKEDWESLNETLQLLRDKEALASVMESFEYHKKGENPPHKTFKEIFGEDL